MNDSQQSAIKSKCFIYLRRSQEREDRQSLSIEKQDKQVRQIIDRNTLSPIFLPSEERSAKYPGRPIFNDMMNRIESREARYIAVWALSRLSRNPIDGGRVIYALDSGQLLAIHTPTRTFRNTPDDKMILAIELALAKKNNDDLSVQVREGFEVKRAHGQYPGPAPIGYKNAIIRPGERNLVPDPDDAPKIIKLFEMAATKLYTLNDMWRETQNIGLLSHKGKILGKQTVVEILKRRAYAGWFKYGSEEWHEGTYESLISLDLFNKVQLSMGWARQKDFDKPATTSGRNYPFKGLLLCKTCRFNVTAYTKSKNLATGNLAEYVFYTCTKKNKVIKCEEPQLSDKLLETEIKTNMSDFEIGEADALECKNWVNQLYKSYIGKKNQYIPVWLNDQKEAKKALDVLDEKLEMGTIGDERYKIRAAKHEAMIARTKQLLTNSNQDAESWLELANEIFSGVTNIGDVFEIANDEERRRMMMFLGSNWYLSNKKVELTPRRPLDLLYNTNQNTVWRARPDSNRRSSP